MGTRGYRAPEQAGSMGNVDPRADLYGVGATLWVALTREPPHLLEEEPFRAEALGQLRPGLREVVARATERDPNHRFESARAMLDALGRARTVGEEPPAPVRRAGRLPALAAGLLGFGILVAVATRAVVPPSEVVESALPEPAQAEVDPAPPPAPPSPTVEALPVESAARPISVPSQPAPSQPDTRPKGVEFPPPEASPAPSGSGQATIFNVEVRPRGPSYKVRLDGGEAKVAPLRLQMAPGEHSIALEQGGAEGQKKHLTVTAPDGGGERSVCWDFGTDDWCDAAGSAVVEPTPPPGATP